LRILISDYIENNLTISQRKEFETYLDINPESKKQVDLVRRVMVSLNKMPVVKTSDSFQGNLYKRIAAEREARSRVKPKRSFTGFTPMMVGLSAVVVVAVVMLGLELMPTNTTQAGFQPSMTEGRNINVSPQGRQVKESDLAEADNDSSEIMMKSASKPDFQDRIQLVGDNRP